MDIAEDTKQEPSTSTTATSKAQASSSPTSSIKPNPPTSWTSTKNLNTTCTIPSCQKQFTTTSDTRRHEREVHHLHGGVSEYRCELCPPESKRGLKGDKPFARKWNLQDHISRVHSVGKASATTTTISPSSSSVKTEVEEEGKAEGRRAVAKKRKNSEAESVSSDIVGQVRLRQLEEENVGLKEKLRVMEEKLASSTEGPESRELEKLRLQLRLAEIEKADLRDKVKKLEEGR